MNNFSYQLYQAERIKSTRELRDADARAGEQVKRLARLRLPFLSASHKHAAYETVAHNAIRQSCVTAAR